MPARRNGFTVVELLVAVGILTLLLSAVLSLTSRTLGYTSRTALVNERLEQLNDVLGYIGLTARASIAAPSGGEFSFPDVTDATATATFQCDVSSATSPCVAFVVPVVSRSSANDVDLNVTDVLVLGYQLLPADDWSTAPVGFQAQGGSYVLLEHRYSHCPANSTPCAAPSAVDVSTVETSLVLDGIDPGVVAGAFGFDLDEREFTIALQLIGVGRLADVSVPSDGPLSLTVVSRR